MKHLLQIFFSLCLLIALPTAASAAPLDDSTTECTGCVFSSKESCEANLNAPLCGLEMRVRITGVSGLCLQEDAPFGPCKEEFPCRTKIKVEYKANDVVVYGEFVNGNAGYLNTLNPTFGNWAVANELKTDMPCGLGPVVFDSIIVDVNCGGVVHCTYEVTCTPCVN